ncbi:alpha/beta hydrolase [Roseomonas marmotae]|uniref:alpha/beta hydrolase n=1 Tax=Roseomonas marmotae TaxID=2768161 RepID=UPI0023503443|nr:alpha/beta hydrolase [Roseomonas marmotae]
MHDRRNFAIRILAPEHPFPSGLEDCEDALRWASRHLPALIGRDGPLVLAGDSAGGNLAAVIAQRLHAEIPMAGQVLVYPVTDARFDTASYLRHGSGLTLTRDDMRWFFEHYAPPEQWPDPALSPLRQPEVHSAPPTVVALAEYDVLHDEGKAYAGRLEAAGRLAARRFYPGVTHGFLRLHNLVDTADQAVTELAADIRSFCVKAACGASFHPEAPVA